MTDINDLMIIRQNLFNSKTAALLTVEKTDYRILSLNLLRSPAAILGSEGNPQLIENKTGGGAWESNPPSPPPGEPQLDLKSRPATRPDSPPLGGVIVAETRVAPTANIGFIPAGFHASECQSRTCKRNFFLGPPRSRHKAHDKCWPTMIK